MKAVLALAGKGTRLYPLGSTSPKCLLTILNKPILQWTLEALQKNGITQSILVIDSGEFGQRIRKYAETLSSEFHIEVVVQAEQKGTADVVQTAQSLLSPNEEFLFLAGDDLYGPESISRVVNSPGLAILGQKVDDPEKWGILQTTAEGNLQQIFEKSTSSVGNLANTECMKLNAEIFALYAQLQPSPRGELELTDSLSLLAKTSPIRVVEVSDYWLPIGYPWHMLNATEKLMQNLAPALEGTVEENVTIKGAVVLPKSSIIKSGTYIEGNVIVGENTVIGPNAYLRENVVIGSHCKVGFSVEVKNSIIGSGTQVSHLSYIGDSILGENVNFSGGSMIANKRHDAKTVSAMVKGTLMDTGRIKFGAVIGDNVKLGAGTIMYPGRKIWPGLTTLPGQVVDKDIEQ